MPKNKNPVISVVTPTFNRANELGDLIDSIQNQTLDHPLFEMIIVDDGSTDNTKSLVHSLIEKVNFNLKYFTKKNQGPGVARNHGIKKSKGELILFIDSDCEADPHWMEIIYDHYTKEGFYACGGPDAAKSDFTPFQKAIDYSMTSFLTTGGMRGHSKNMIAKFYPRTHNMGVKRKLIKKIGGFGNLRFGEDIELSHRIRQSGANIKFILNAIVYHRRRTSLKLFFKQIFNSGVARINLYKIDSALLEPIHFLPSLGLFLVLGVLIGLFLSITILEYIFLFGFLLFLFQCIVGAVLHKDLRVLGCLIFVIPTQVLGYSTGFLAGITKRIIFKSKTFTGFTKKFYSD